MKRKLTFTLSLVVILSLLLLSMTACNKGNSQNGDKQVPVYQGMTITKANSTLASEGESLLWDNALQLGTNDDNNGDNGNHYGDYKGDHTDRDDEFDSENPYPENAEDETIEEQIKSSLEVIGSPDTIYYATPGEDIYINIHINNPDSFEIISFTLNGKKYSSYMFEDGSDMETIILKYNVGEAAGIVEYTIDAIKYVDGTEIKDVIIDGDKTVMAGIKTEHQVAASVTSVDIGTNAISFNVNVKDNNSLVEFSGGKVKAVLYDGFSIVSEKDLIIGDNSVTFDGLKTNTLYQYAIAGYYDDLSGAGFGMNILDKDAFYTDSVVLFDNITVGQESISFGYLWHEDHVGKAISALKLYCGDAFAGDIAADATSVSELLSATSYRLVAEYPNADSTESIYIEFTTLAKAVPEISVHAPTVTQTGIGFTVTEIDPDNVGSVTKIELIHESGILVAESCEQRSFEDLLSDNAYTVKVTYTYDLNDGAGAKTLVKELTAKTDAKAMPSVAVENTAKGKESLSFAVSVTDPDKVGAITKVELLHGNDATVLENKTEHEIKELLSDNSYTFRVTYTYDLNNGAGAKTLVKELTAKTDAKVMPSVAVENTAKGKESLSFAVSVTDPDNVGAITKVKLVHGGEVVKTLANTTEHEIKELLSDNSYTLRVTYTYDLNDGEGESTITKELSVTTKAKAAPKFEIQNIKTTSGSIDADHEAQDTDGTLISYTVALYNGDALVETNGEQKISFAGLDYGVDYTVCITYTYELNDGKGEQTESYREIIRTASSGLAYEVSGDTCTVTGIGTCEDTVIVIGKYIDGYRVVGIGANAFENCTATIIVIPETVKTIGNRAFYNATGITEITVPASVTSIGTQVFYKASNLSTVYYNSSYSDTNNPFLNVASITTVVFGGTKIPYNILKGSTNVKNVVIADSVKSIGDRTFSGCTGLTSVTIGNSVTSIGYEAFSGCSGLTSVTVGNSVTSIGNYAFQNCTNLTSVTVGNSVTKIGASAFDGCTRLTSVYITDIAKWCGISFGSSASNPLYYAGNLYLNGTLVTELVTPEGVTSIGNAAFSGCTSLTSVTVGNSVTSIGSLAFYNCTSLTSVYITDIAKWCGISFGNYVSNPLYYAGNLYLNGTLVTELVTPEGVTSIGNAAFSGCTSLTSVTIGNSVTNIGICAFSGCTSLTSVTIPDSVTSIGSSVFEDCTSLTSVTIPDSVTSIGFHAFFECTSLKSITIPDSVTSIGDSAFLGCTSLTSITIPDSVTSIGDSAFWGCTSLTSVTIGNSVTTIGDYAFAYCSSLTSVTIPNSVTSIGKSAFNKCSSLTSVTIPNSVTTIGSYAFYDCSKLTSVTIGNNVTSIGYAAFCNCTSLTIYCEAASEPSGWDSDWNYSNRPVVWGYTGEEYSYNFVTNGGEEIESITAKIHFTLPTPIREGWYFAGWYDNAELSGNPVSSPYFSKTAHTLYAKWMTEEEYLEYLASLDGSSFEKAYIITSGESLPAVIDTAGEYVYFKFTATESKTYTFQSSGSYDTYGYLYNSSQSQLSSDDDSGDGSNFKITRSMSAGETVYLKVKLYSGSSTGTFTVTVS